MRDDPSDQRRTYTIGLDLEDPRLLDALADGLEGHASLDIADPDEAPDVIISDDGAPLRTVALRATDRAELYLPADADLILAAAHLLAAGYNVIGGGEPKPDDDHDPVVLTPREHDVAGLLVEGASNKHIARALDISERTAKFHVAAVLRKLGARNRSEAVAIALRDGLITF